MPPWISLVFSLPSSQEKLPNQIRERAKGELHPVNPYDNHPPGLIDLCHAFQFAIFNVVSSLFKNDRRNGKKEKWKRKGEVEGKDKVMQDVLEASGIPDVEAAPNNNLHGTVGETAQSDQMEDVIRQTRYLDLRSYGLDDFDSLQVKLKETISKAEKKLILDRVKRRMEASMTTEFTLIIRSFTLIHSELPPVPDQSTMQEFNLHQWKDDVSVSKLLLEDIVYKFLPGGEEFVKLKWENDQTGSLQGKKSKGVERLEKWKMGRSENFDPKTRSKTEAAKSKDRIRVEKREESKAKQYDEVAKNFLEGLQRESNEIVEED